MAFGENVDPSAAIRGIIGLYPFSAGIFRELLQNSDDAGAKKTDRRNHQATSIYHPNLSEMQGPALLAYNDALFTEEDWAALQNIHRSSKRADTSKIGKYGIGFRSSYHVTDSPQILSGSYLAILDPLHQFSTSGGIKLDFLKDSLHTDHLASFDAIPQSFYSSGSIIRLPLRKAPSEISDKLVEPSEIRTLLDDFIKDEISIALLFLKNISRIEVHEVDTHGERHRLAISTITRDSRVYGGDQCVTFTCSVKTVIGVNPDTTERWRIQEANFSQDDAIAALSQRTGFYASSTLMKHKLLPHVALAIPLTISTHSNVSGRLFTYLPLPLPTGFPVHIHGLFALTADRQHLRNGYSMGMVAGSDDMVLVEWNQLLFDTYIPKAWVSLLETLAKVDSIPEIYRAWPSKPIVASQDVQNLPLHVIRYLGISCSPVWPIQPIPIPQTKYFGLKYVLVTMQDVSSAVIEALASLGLKISCPPPFISNLLLENENFDCIFLSPKNAHSVLQQNHISDLEQISPAILTVLLRFLVSGPEGLINITNLPLFTTIGGDCISLVAPGPEIHYILNKIEIELFGTCDKSAIALDQLEPSIACELALHGPEVLNVQLLTPETVIRHIHSLGLVQGQQKIDRSLVDWLSTFWAWMGRCSIAPQLYPQITSLHLLPTHDGLRTMNDPIHVEIGVHPSLWSSLEKSGISFLHPDFPPSVRNIVGSLSAGLFRNVNNIHCLLDSLSVDAMTRLDPDSVHVVLNHITHYAQEQPLSIDDLRNLRNLPIFPLLVPPNADENSSFIPDGKTVIGLRTTHLNILPITQDTVFIDGNKVAPAFVNIFNCTAGPHLSDSGLLHWTLERFNTQPLHIQAGYIRYMAQNQRYISSHSVEVLQKIPFVTTLDGTQHSPRDLIDPQSTIAPLFGGNLDRFPRAVNGFDHAIIGDLKSLNILQHALTSEIVHERIKFISGNPSPNCHTIARNLLQTIFKAHFSCASLSIPSTYKWLPTKQGLLGPDECHDQESHRVDLFNKVLPLLDEDIKISQSLRVALGWNRPLPLLVLTKQLSCVLNTDDPYDTVKIIIKELSRRDLDTAVLDDIRGAISERPWIPVQSRQLARTSDAVFSNAAPAGGFFQISFTQSDHPTSRRFLSRMGCHERPAESAIILKLMALQMQPPDTVIVQKALLLLGLLPADISDEIRSQVLVPTTSCRLLPAHAVFYNDIGERSCFINFGASDVNLAHEGLGEDMARLLHMQWLGHKFSDLQATDDDMGEQLTTTIRKTLREYTEKQILLELLANASDAGANSFEILVDQYQALDQTLLCTDMVQFHQGPSLVIHNDGVFTESDFRGIVKTGIGSKERKSDSIGQFGLGALTMFHITELVMLVSGDYVLFMNPSKECFPLRNRATWRFSLAHIRSFYPGHLDCINGLFGFDSSSKLPYQGTLFRLPLRNDSHITGSPILTKLWTLHDIQKLIEPFEECAHEFMLFTRISNITFSSRDVRGRFQQRGIHATCSDATSINESLSHVITIQRTLPRLHSTDKQAWYVISMSIPSTKLPGYSASLGSRYRLRSPGSIGLAALLDSHDADSKTTPTRKLFSVLPLPTTTTLPVHLTAPFILSSDRRQIRLDEYDNSESKYNRWLLSSAIPPLYISLLEGLLRFKDNNMLWWPGNSTEEDNITRILVTSFYAAHLKQSDRPILRCNYSTGFLLPSDAVLLQAGLPDGVKKTLSLVKPHELAVSLSSRVSSRAIKEANLAAAGPSFVKDAILHKSNDIAPQLTFEEIHDVIAFIQRDKSLDLIGLPLLPLADGSFAAFSKTPSTTYFYWKHASDQRLLFPLNRFVNSQFFDHPKFSTHKLVENGYNVASLTSSTIKRLVGEHLLEVHDWSAPNQQSETWISTFWDEYPRLMPTTSDISSFPLVPTTHPGRYISIERCKDRSVVLLANTTEETQIWDLLAKLDLLIVDQDSESFPRDLRQILQHRDFPTFIFHHLLLALKAFEPGLPQRFGQLNRDSHVILAKWARERISTANIHDNLMTSVARNLPIWPITHIDGSITFSTANDLIMLPPGISEDVAKQFLIFSFSPYETSLVKIKTSPLTIAELFARVRDSLPPILPAQNVASYKQLLSTMISNGLNHPTNTNVPVPNCNRVICLSNTVYARDPLFLAAFVPGSQHFVLEDYRDLEPSLSPLGLKRQANLDTAVFKVCALAMEADAAENRIERAAILFRVYGEDLPLRIGRGREEWKEIDAIRFAPRADGRRKTPWPEASVYANHLPLIVAPNKLLLEAHEAIAWTQRALFLEPPHERVLIANPTLGCPAVGEVVEHLRILALQFAQRYPSNARILDDLKQTYFWLEQHSNEAQPVIREFHAEALFLNVDDPELLWEWKPADRLVLETDEDLGFCRPVRHFLLPYRKLLIASGAYVIENSTVPQLTFAVSSDAVRLERTRSTFQEMRKGRKLTDVVFLTDDGNAFPAHRSFLATCSTYFYDSFTSEIGTNNNHQEPIILHEYSSNCVRLVLDYAYTGVIPSSDRADWEMLLEMMVLSDYWDFQALHEAVQLKIIQLRIINPLRIAYIKQQAEKAQAKMVTQACIEYEQKNRHLIQIELMESDDAR